MHSAATVYQALSHSSFHLILTAARRVEEEWGGEPRAPEGPPPSSPAPHWRGPCRQSSVGFQVPLGHRCVGPRMAAKPAASLNCPLHPQNEKTRPRPLSWLERWNPSFPLAPFLPAVFLQVCTHGCLCMVYLAVLCVSMCIHVCSMCVCMAVVCVHMAVCACMDVVYVHECAVCTWLCSVCVCTWTWYVCLHCCAV